MSNDGICTVYLVDVGAAIYVGSTANLPTRRSNHKSRLRAGKHQSQALQAAFNQTGQFALTVLETCLSEDRLALESAYIIAYADDDRLVNSNKDAAVDGGTACRPVKVSWPNRESVFFPSTRSAARHFDKEQCTVRAWCEGKNSPPGITRLPMYEGTALEGALFAYATPSEYDPPPRFIRTKQTTKQPKPMPPANSQTKSGVYKVRVAWPNGSHITFASVNEAADFFLLNRGTVRCWASGRRKSPRDSRDRVNYTGTPLEGALFSFLLSSKEGV